MSITPDKLYFKHKQYDKLPSYQRVSFPDIGYVNTDSPRIGDIATVYGSSSEDWVSASVYRNYANIHIRNDVNKWDGYESATIKLYYVKYEESPGFTSALGKNVTYGKPILIGTVYVNIHIEYTRRLNLSPGSLLFNYELFGNKPSPQVVSVSSENVWTISENTSWLSVSKYSGRNDGSFEVSADPTGLNEGKHTAEITVKDRLSTEKLSVTLLVSEPSDGVYLYINPKEVSFGYTLLGNLPPFRRIEVSASGNYIVTANQPWIGWTVNLGKKGIGYLDIKLQNLSDLELGSYKGIVFLTLGKIRQTVEVILRIYPFAKKVLRNDELYFTEEDNIINVSSGRYDTQLSVIVNSSFEGKSYSIPYAIPFYKGSAEKRIGAEAKKMIDNRPFISIDNASIVTPYKPVNTNIRIKEESVFEDNTLHEIDLDNISFIKGFKPNKHWLSDMPTKLYLTKKGILIFSFLNNKSLDNKIEITGDLTKTYISSIGFNEFYTVVVPLESENLKEGDKIKVSSNDVAIEVQIKPEGTDHFFLFWENQWGCWDCFECTGSFMESSNVKQTSFTIRKNEHQRETKVLEVFDKRVFIINTGWVYTDKEVNALQKMMLSKNVYIVKDGVNTKVRLTSKRLVLTKTNRFLKSFDLKFEGVIS